MSSIENVRKEYQKDRLSEKNVHPDPFTQFEGWLNEAMKSAESEPTAMTLSTSDLQGNVSSRIILLKGFCDKGFVFYSNYRSKKGLQLHENPKAALLFFWPTLERQVRIEGRVSELPASESDIYYNSRPEGSRLGAWASPQSQVIPNTEYLDERFKEYLAHFTSEPVKRPPFWGGYRLTPQSMEFWQGRENRLHDRILYQLQSDNWTIKRLAP